MRFSFFNFIGFLPLESIKSPSLSLSLSIRLHGSKKTGHKTSLDWTVSSPMHTDAIASDVVAPSPWKIFGCQNGKSQVLCLCFKCLITCLNSICPKFETYAGLRLFREAKDGDSHRMVGCSLDSILFVMVWDFVSEICFYP